MHDDTNGKKHASDTTPPSRLPPAGASEAEYLAREADDAREAASHTLAEMQQTLRDAADVRAWARSYPWTTLGAAAAAGFLAASTLLPKKKPRDEENEALLERILTDEQIESRLRELAAEDVRKPAKGGLLHTLATTLVQTFGPAVQTAVAAALAGQAPPQGPFDEDAAAEAGDHETANGQQSSAPPPLPDQE